MVNNKNSNFLHTQQFRTILFLIILIIFVGICILMARPFFKILGWTAALTIISLPLFNFLNKKIKNKSMCSLLSCFIILVVVIVPATFLLVEITRQGLELSNNMQSYIKADNITQFINSSNVKITKFIYKLFEQKFDLSLLKLETKLPDIITWISESMGTLAKNVVVNIFSIFIVFLSTFFLLKDKDEFLNFIKSFAPLSEEYAQMALNKAALTIKAAIYGWILIGIIQGLLLGIGFWFLGLPSPVFWGCVTFMCSFIPFIGTPLVWLPASIILLIKGIYLKGIILFLWGILVVSLIDNFLRPIFIGAQMRLHPMVVFFSIFGGLLFFKGPLGLIMGPVILAVTISLLDVFKHRMEEEG